MLRLLEKHCLPHLRRAVEKALARVRSAGMRSRSFFSRRKNGGPRCSRWTVIPICGRVQVAPPDITIRELLGGVPMSGKDPSTVLLEHHLKVLKLPTFLRDYKSVAAVCGQERCDYPTFLLRLAERELIDRERRAAERRIREAGSRWSRPSRASTSRPSPRSTRRWCGSCLRGEYMAKKENVLLVGNPGTGKTHLATALGFAACARAKRCASTTTTGLVTELLEARENRTLQRLQKQLERLDLLILDELGYVPFSKPGRSCSLMWSAAPTNAPA